MAAGGFLFARYVTKYDTGEMIVKALINLLAGGVFRFGGNLPFGVMLCLQVKIHLLRYWFRLMAAIGPMRRLKNICCNAA